MPNYYDILGVNKAASEKEIRQVFRRLARKYHPDVNQNDEAAEEKFKEINEAYTVLNDPESRKKYDRYGDDWKNADRFEQAGKGPWSGQGDDERFSVFGGRGSSIFEDMFSGGGNFTNFRRPPAEYNVEVTLEEAFHGASRLLQTQDGRRQAAGSQNSARSGQRIPSAPHLRRRSE